MWRNEIINISAAHARSSCQRDIVSAKKQRVSENNNDEIDDENQHLMEADINNGIEMPSA